MELTPRYIVLLYYKKRGEKRMNETITILTEHRSRRKFKEGYKISEMELNLILQSAKQAPSFENGQFYSMIRLVNPNIKKKLVELNPRNSQIKNCSEALLFVADLNRTRVVSEENQTFYDVTNNYDALITATTDASLACENAVIASESLGYGTVIVGGIRRNSMEIIDLCSLPEYCLPLFILCIGSATDNPEIKPRLPKEVSVFEDQYSEIDYSKICDYDITIKKYRDTGIDRPWIQKFVNYFKSNKLKVTESALRKQKFIK